MLVTLRNAFLLNCFLFTTLMISPSLWTMDMSKYPPIDSCAMTLKGEDECLWDKSCLNFFCQGCRGNICCLHLMPSQAALDILPRAVLSWCCFKYSSFYCGFEPKPNCPSSVFHPRSSERMTVSGCQLGKFSTSHLGLNSCQSPDSEVYPMDGWRSLLLIRTWK